MAAAFFSSISFCLFLCLGILYSPAADGLGAFYRYHLGLGGSWASRILCKILDHSNCEELQLVFMARRGDWRLPYHLILVLSNGVMDSSDPPRTQLVTVVQSHSRSENGRES